MKRGAPKRRKPLSRKPSAGLGRSEPLPRGNGPARVSRPENVSERRKPAPARWRNARAPRAEYGAWGPGERLVQHHVSLAQVVEAAGGDVWDPRNSITLATPTHDHHHDGSTWKIPLSALFDSHYSFAAETFGCGGAYEHLRRHYSGSDPRLDALLAGA